MGAVSGDAATPGDSSRAVEVHAEDDGVHVDGAAGGVVILAWSEAIRVARRIIEIARSHGELS
jgi:hypothetical protein